MKRERGFTYLGVLVAIALLGIAMSAASEVWVTLARRQHLAQLEWVGRQYVQAIGSYYESTPGVVVKTYPTSLQDLIRDPRYLTPQRHLRRLYVNPFSGQLDWSLVKVGSGISGIKAMVSTDTGNMEREFVYVPPMPGRH